MSRDPAIRRRAVFSPDRRYRYTLRRDTGVLGGESRVLFVMLNPSTADAVEDDPTIRRCIGYATKWGFAELVVANAYAYRSTDPKALRQVDDPVGPDNDYWLDKLAGQCEEAIAAWGAHIDPDRERQVIDLVEHQRGTMYCLGQTKNLHPKHPLYLSRDAKREPLKRFAVSAR